MLPSKKHWKTHTQKIIMEKLVYKRGLLPTCDMSIDSSLAFLGWLNSEENRTSLPALKDNSLSSTYKHSKPSLKSVNQEWRICAF